MDDEFGAMLAPARGEVSRLQQETDALREEMSALTDTAERASRAIESGLLRAVRSGKFGFEDMGRIALSVMNQIAQAAVRNGLEAVLRGGGSGGGGASGLIGLGTSLLSGLLGLPGRATGGPVAPGRPYLVGERGPEVFLPTSAGQIVPGVGQGGGRDVRVAITINGSSADAPRALAKSARQVARAVRGALGE
jgi:hypothetical protein